MEKGKPESVPNPNPVLSSLPECDKSLAISGFDNEILEVAKNRISQAFFKNEDDTAQAASEIPWDIIITAVLQFLSDCMAKRKAGGANPTDPNAYIQMAKDRRLIPRIMVRNRIASALNEEHGQGAWRRFRGKDLVESVFEAAANSSSQEMQRLVKVAEDI